jgi:hypothetical protein
MVIKYSNFKKFFFLGSWLLKMGPTCPETSVQNCHSQSNSPQQRGSNFKKVFY